MVDSCVFSIYRLKSRSRAVPTWRGAGADIGYYLTPPTQRLLYLKPQLIFPKHRSCANPTSAGAGLVVEYFTGR